MKKILSLVLAAAMLSTTAMAATWIGTGTGSGVSDTTLRNGGQVDPGTKLNIAADDFKNTAVSTNTLAGIGWRLSSEYFTISAKKFDKGANLVKEVKINDDDARIQIVLNDNFELTAPNGENLVIKELSLKARKSYDIDNDTLYTSAGDIKKSATYKYSTTTSESFKVGYDKVTNKVDISTSNNGYILGQRVEFTNDTDSSIVYETVSASFGDIYMEGRVYDGDKVYVDIDTDVNKEVLKMDDTAAMRFYNITTSGLPTANTLQISAEEDEFVYKIVDNKLVASGLKWSADDYAWVGKVRTSTSYVISDVALKAAASATDAPTTANPETGANDVVGIAAALAVVSLVAAGAVSLKK